jgi:hypothetical protein
MAKDTLNPTRKKPFAATNASRKMLECHGWTVDRCDRTIPHCFITKDLFGIFDLIAMSPVRGIMGIQVTGGTSTSNFHARVAKIKAEPRAGIWLASGGRIQVHSWEKVADTKDRAFRWLEITSLAEHPIPHPDPMHPETTPVSGNLRSGRVGY